MKAFLAACCLLLAGVAAFAADPEVPAAEQEERARIESRRAAVESQFAETEKDCYRKFSVNRCLDGARKERRQALGTLRREEMAVNDARRQREAKARRDAIQAKSSPEKLQQNAERAGHALEASQRRTERLEARQRDGATLPEGGASAPPPGAKPRQAHAEAAAAQQEKREEAARRKARRDKKLTERTKPPAAPLPAPVH